MKNLILLITSLIVFSVASRTQTANTVLGVTLCGAEFGENNLPGTINVNYTYPVASEVSYFSKKGAQVIQLPFKWERIQRTLGGPLDQHEVSLISQFVDMCAARNVMVTLVMQNFGRYQINGTDYVIGSPRVTRNNFRDVWTKIAATMMNKMNIFAFSIMTEPHDMGIYTWFESAQQAIFGIREVDRSTTILVDGDNYSSPETWAQYNDRLKYLVDPANNMMFNAHCYFDDDRSGHYKRSYEECGANEMTGVERIRPFINWINENGKRGFVGEFGVPRNDVRWLRVMDNFLRYLMQNGIGGCYWAAGHWWKDYPLSIEPDNGNDQPQMYVYSRYLNIAKENVASERTNGSYVTTLR